MLMTMMTGAIPGTADSTAKGEVKTGDLQQANGQVWPGTKDSRSRSRNPPSRDPTKYKQSLEAPPPIGQLLGYAAVKLRPPFSSTVVSRL
jgi:hypothetical protein